MTSRSDHQRNNRFRAPQFAMGRSPMGESPFGDAPAPQAPDEIEWAPMPAEAVQEGPKIIVRRKRQLALPTETPTDESNPDEGARGPRVFKLKRNDDLPPVADPSPDEPFDLAAAEAAFAALDAEPAPAPRAPPLRRRATPEFRRAGPVTIARPQAEPGAESGLDEADRPSLAQLMAQFEALNEQLAHLTSRRPARLEIDLTIDRRWDAIDESLRDLLDSMTVRPRIPVF